jgi:hypothetical protein
MVIVMINYIVNQLLSDHIEVYMMKVILWLTIENL